MVGHAERCRRNLRRGRTGFLALVLPELGIPYFGELAGLVLRAAQPHEWKVVIEQTLGTREGERTILASLGTHLIDGAIVSPEALSQDDFAELAPGIPVVMLGEHTVDLPIDRVGIDNVRAAAEAVRHLLSLGRTRIAAIGAHPHRGTAAQRLNGYRSALTAAGLPLRDELVATALNYHRRDGGAAMGELLALPEPPDAVFCFNDLLAVGALRTAAERGVRVPEDMAVVGFDNNEEGAYIRPSLTTVAPDKAAIAEAAVSLLCRRVETAGPPPEHVQTPFKLEIRESTGA